MQPLKVWDLPVRLFHWAIVVLVLLAWATQQFNFMDWHVWIGYVILTLVLFRIAWGFVGSDTARFTRFLRSPSAAWHHLARLRAREADREIGHNAAGGWMVLAMLVLLLVQGSTGLFSNDDANTEGPLMHLVGKDRSNQFSHLHSLNFTFIEIAVALHVLAIVLYAVLKRQNLLRPMITGEKTMPADAIAPRLVNPLLALLLLLLAAGVVAWVVRL